MGLARVFQERTYPDQPELWPIFVTAGSVTPLLEQDAADADPPWAGLCVGLHAGGPLFAPAAKVALQACDGLPADHGRVILSVLKAGVRNEDMQDIIKQLPEQTRRNWELTEYEEQGWFGELVEKGRVQGREEGLEQGLRISLLRVLDAHGLSPTPEQRDAIEACKDTDQLGRWLERAIRAESVADVLAPCA